MSRAFLDAALGQPLHPAAIEAREGFTGRAWPDPDQPYHEGRLSAQILNAARETVAAVVGVSPAGVSFHPRSLIASLAITGAQYALRASTAQARVAEPRVSMTGDTPEPINHAASEPLVYSSRVERAAVLNQLAVLPGPTAELVDVDHLGRIDTAKLATSLKLAGNSSTLVLLQSANLELGTRQPLELIPTLSAGSPATLVTDATGSLGLIDIDSSWSVLFADATGWAGPGDVGVLAVRDLKSWRLPSEHPLSPTIGNVNGYPTDSVGVLAATEAAAALHAVASGRPAQTARLTRQIERIRHELPRLVSDVDVLGDPTDRLPNIVTFSVLYADGERLASELDRLGVAVGSGSACASRVGLPSHVLAAIGALTHGNVRVSLPIGATDAAIDHFLAALPAAVHAIRSEAGAP